MNIIPNRISSTLPRMLRLMGTEVDKLVPKKLHIPLATSLSVKVMSTQTKPEMSPLVKFVKENHDPLYTRGGTGREGIIGINQVLAAVGEKLMSQEEAVISGERMRGKISESSLKQINNWPENATEPNPIRNILVPNVLETKDLAGEVDPSNQNKYSPVPGLLHKYEMVLLMNAINCSSHCRYCYRLDLFNGSSGKEAVDIDLAAQYIESHNKKIAELIATQGVLKEGHYVDRESGNPLIPIREVLFSGGDPMTLPNGRLVRQMETVINAGIETVRIGTKELSFNPSRFDHHFFGALDAFHDAYSHVRFEIVGHYTHPFELLNPKIDENGKADYRLASYAKSMRYDLAGTNGSIREDIKYALQEINKRHDFLGHWNQFPIIAGVNDSSDVLRLLFKTQHQLGINAHNVYACREIKGNAHFRKDNDIARQFEVVEQAKIGLSGIENHPRLVMSTEWGKTEIVGVDGDMVYMRINRRTHNRTGSSMIVVDTSKIGEDEKFYWLTKKVIDSPGAIVSGKGTLDEIHRNEGLIAALKLELGREFAPHHHQADDKKMAPSTKITVLDQKTGKTTVYTVSVDPSKRMVLSEFLHAEKLVHAACGHKCSCTTCAVGVASTSKNKRLQVPEAKIDEQDMLDTLGAKESGLRLGCQVELGKIPELKVTIPKE